MLWDMLAWATGTLSSCRAMLPCLKAEVVQEPLKGYDNQFDLTLDLSPAEHLWTFGEANLQQGALGVWVIHHCLLAVKTVTVRLTGVQQESRDHSPLNSDLERMKAIRAFPQLQLSR